jgi:antitoxin component of MazEF toxin-antitoxin module
MPYEPKVRLSMVGNSYKVTIPMDMINDLGWEEGDELRIGMDKGIVTIRKQEN